MSETKRSSPFPAPREGSDNPTIPPPVLTRGGDDTAPFPFVYGVSLPLDEEWDPDVTEPTPAHPLNTQSDAGHRSVTDHPETRPNVEPVRPRRRRLPTGNRRAPIIFLMLAVVAGAATLAVLKGPWRGQSASPSHDDSAAGASTDPLWISSGRYHLPDDIPPGLYRVGRQYTIYDKDDKVVRESSADLEGTTLLSISDRERAGTIEIKGGAWPLINDGPVDPTRFQDGTYLVSFDLQPGTYQVTIAPQGAGIASATRLDERNQIIQIEQVDESDATDSVIIVVDPTDFGLSFTGQIKKVD